MMKMKKECRCACTAVNLSVLEFLNLSVVQVCMLSVHISFQKQVLAAICNTITVQEVGYAAVYTVMTDIVFSRSVSNDGMILFILSHILGH